MLIPWWGVVVVYIVANSLYFPIIDGGRFYAALTNSQMVASASG